MTDCQSVVRGRVFITVHRLHIALGHHWSNPGQTLRRNWTEVHRGPRKPPGIGIAIDTIAMDAKVAGTVFKLRESLDHNVAELSRILAARAQPHHIDLMLQLSLRLPL